VGAHAKYGMPPFALNAHAMLLPSIHVTVGNILDIRSLHPVAPRQFRLVSSIVSSVSLVVAVLVDGILEHVPASSDHWKWNVQLQRNWNVQVAKKKNWNVQVAKKKNWNVQLQRKRCWHLQIFLEGLGECPQIASDFQNHLVLYRIK
jgi:hypothetical protein